MRSAPEKVFVGVIAMISQSAVAEIIVSAATPWVLEDVLFEELPIQRASSTQAFIVVSPLETVWVAIVGASCSQPMDEVRTEGVPVVDIMRGLVKGLGGTVEKERYCLEKRRFSNEH